MFHGKNPLKPTTCCSFSSVAVVGSGAVGSYYGARLHEAGHNVKFFMRNEHYAHCVVNGLNISSVDGDMYIPPSLLQVHPDVDSIGPVDWVIIAIKSSFLEAIPPLIEPLVKKDTRVLAIMNGFIDDDLVEMVKCMPLTAIYGGMAFICSNRVSPGNVRHTSYGSLNGGLASHCSSNAERLQHMSAIDDLWATTKVKYTSIPSLARGRWEKSCYNLSFSGISVAMGGISVDKIVADEGLRVMADKILDEAIAIANADLLSRGEDKSTYLGEAEKTKMWYLSENMGAFNPSTTLDLLAGKTMEVKYIFRKPLDRAKELGIDTPLLETLVIQIEAKQNMKNISNDAISVA
mmetsp:Transcript_55/g.97  ORF Transcript_55/g.97 Transcript_55/m.97 type:complete len:348 (-) Transcript_55:197-1240(-)